MALTTLKELYTNIGQTVRETQVSALITGFLNVTLQEIWDAHPWHFKRRKTTFATVASQQRYALPEQGVAKINRIWETTNDHRLHKRSLAWLRAVDADPPTGVPDYWIPLSYTQVATQPANASEVFAKSSAAGTQTLYIEGFITGGYRRTANVALTGTTAVSLDTTITTWIQIDKCYLSASTTGVVTLHEDSGTGTELARIAIGDLYARYLSLLLYPTPASAVTHQVDITRGIADMANDTDEPLLPEDFHDLLLDMADLKELIKGDDPARFALVEKHRVKRRNDLRTWLFAGGDPGDDGFDDRLTGSNLGAWYPAGRW